MNPKAVRSRRPGLPALTAPVGSHPQVKTQPRPVAKGKAGPMTQPFEGEEAKQPDGVHLCPDRSFADIAWWTRHLVPVVAGSDIVLIRSRLTGTSEVPTCRRVWREAGIRCRTFDSGTHHPVPPIAMIL